MTAEKLAEEIRQPLKQNGYKKNKLTWYKSDGRVTVVFSVQKSQYGSDLWYYNFGIGLNELEGRTINTISKCCIIERLVPKQITGIAGFVLKKNLRLFRYQGLRKQTAKLNIMFVFANLYQADRKTLTA